MGIPEKEEEEEEGKKVWMRDSAEKNSVISVRIAHAHSLGNGSMRRWVYSLHTRSRDCSVLQTKVPFASLKKSRQRPKKMTRERALQKVPPFFFFLRYHQHQL